MVNKKEVFEYLQKVDKDFPQPLSDRVDLFEYAKKMIDNGIVVLEKDRDKIMAMGVVYANDYDTGEAYWSMLSVCSEYSGRGLGKKIMNKICDICKEKGFKIVTLHTNISNTVAFRMYENRGFKVCERDGDRVKMSLNLENE